MESQNHGITSGTYIYSFGSLLNFLTTMLSVELALCIPISLTVHFYSGASVLPTFQLIYLNNIHSNVILGIPAMLFLPAISKWADEPSGSGGMGRNILALAFLQSFLSKWFFCWRYIFVMISRSFVISNGKK